jgi:hypothetical protein
MFQDHRTRWTRVPGEEVVRAPCVQRVCKKNPSCVFLPPSYPWSEEAASRFLAGASKVVREAEVPVGRTARRASIPRELGRTTGAAPGGLVP